MMVNRYLGLLVILDVIFFGRKNMNVVIGFCNINVKMVWLVGVGEINRGVCGKSCIGWEREITGLVFWEFCEWGR